jgi:hypothetical protein
MMKMPWHRRGSFVDRLTVTPGILLVARATLFGAALGCAAFGCAAGPAAPVIGRGTLWGYVRAVPRDGVTPAQPGAGPYANRRFRDATLVDYRHPGFVVVYLGADGTHVRADGGRTDPADVPGHGSTAGGRAAVKRVTIQGSAFGPRLVPRHTAIEVGDTVVLRNADAVPHTFACPRANLVRRLRAGEEVTIASADAGSVSVHLLDVPRAEALIFVAPGPYTVASEDGRWELRDLHPGRRTIHAWHPRLPADERRIDVSAGETQRLDLQIGVGNLTAAAGSDGTGSNGTRGDAAGGSAGGGGLDGSPSGGGG